MSKRQHKFRLQHFANETVAGKLVKPANRIELTESAAGHDPDPKKCLAKILQGIERFGDVKFHKYQLYIVGVSEITEFDNANYGSLASAITEAVKLGYKPSLSFPWIKTKQGGFYGAKLTLRSPDQEPTRVVQEGITDL